MTQTEMQRLFFPILEQEGKIYQKHKNILARKAQSNEQIQTITADGLETTNMAQLGDYIIQNQTGAREMYVLSAKKFDRKYNYLDQRDQDWAEYQPKGKIIAIELTTPILKKLQLPQQLIFTASWNESMVAKKGDFIACPLDGEEKEIYRIAQKEFFETYRSFF